MPAPRKPRPRRAMQELEGFARDYAERLHTLEGELSALRSKRDQVIRRAHRAGVPVVAIAELFSLSHQRVSSIVRRS